MRYKEFNKKKVLNDCISLFWNNSYNGTSINAIVKHTRVNRFSLYQEFDNKQGILYEALSLYKERYSNESIKLLDSKEDVRKVLSTFFSSYLDGKTKSVGCFMIYIATELGDNNPKINSLLKGYLLDIENKLIALLNASSQYANRSKLVASNLIFLFCNSMCYCHIQGEKESKDYVSLNLDIILNDQL